MKYVFIDIPTAESSDMWAEEFDNLNAAIERAEYCWNHLTEREKSARFMFQIIESENPDENAINHYCGNILYDWR